MNKCVSERLNVRFEFWIVIVIFFVFYIQLEQRQGGREALFSHCAYASDFWWLLTNFYFLMCKKWADATNKKVFIGPRRCGLPICFVFVCFLMSVLKLYINCFYFFSISFDNDQLFEYFLEKIWWYMLINQDLIR